MLGRACVPAGLLWLWCCPVVGCRFRGPWVALGFPFGGGLRVTLLAWCSAPAGGGLWVTRGSPARMREGVSCRGALRLASCRAGVPARRWPRGRPSRSGVGRRVYPSAGGCPGGWPSRVPWRGLLAGCSWMCLLPWGAALGCLPVRSLPGRAGLGCPEGNLQVSPLVNRAPCWLAGSAAQRPRRQAGSCGSATKWLIPHRGRPDWHLAQGFPGTERDSDPGQTDRRDDWPGSLSRAGEPREVAGRTPGEH